jgi:hypothetical protein
MQLTVERDELTRMLEGVFGTVRRINIERICRRGAITDLAASKTKAA